MTGPSPPALDAADFLADVGPRPARRLLEALETSGHARLALPPGPAGLAASALAQAAAFFARPEADKARLGIGGSPHHRGWSVMHTERDWREQLHFGREESAAESGPSWARLRGPNQWPPAPDGGFRAALEAHLEACAQLGAGLMSALSGIFDLPPQVWEPSGAYLLLKAIAYPAQEAEGPPRRGVAAHVDFSLLTLVAQDGEGGLEAREPGGRWVPVVAEPGILVLHVGEVLEALTGGRLRATPHRVTHRGTARPRLSLPCFFNPPLEAVIPARPAPRREEGDGHVHRVLTGLEEAFQFGEAEWRRKGLNRWCAACCAGA